MSVVENFAELLKHSPDITMDTFAGLLARRPDLSKAQVKELAEACAVIHQKRQLERETLGGDGSDAKKPSSGEGTPLPLTTNVGRACVRACVIVFDAVCVFGVRACACACAQCVRSYIHFRVSTRYGGGGREDAEEGRPVHEHPGGAGVGRDVLRQGVLPRQQRQHQIQEIST
jgi:hypothetical protein